MNILLKIICVFGFLLICGSSQGQDYPKRLVDGQEHYVYTVEPGNTLYGIARAFSIDIQSLKLSNPGAAEGLDIGREILIPLVAIDRKEARKSDVRTDGEHLLHTVQRKETLFSIAKVYGVSVSDITSLNPEAAESLSTGVVLTIPVKMSTTVKEAYLEPARNDTFMVHQVQQGETAFSIAKSYGVSLDSLLSANPEQAEMLSMGAWIVVPKYNDAFREKLEQERLARIEERGFVMPEGRLDTYNIALLLPFELQYHDSLVRAVQQGKSLNIISEIALEFYRGACLALDSLQKLGLRANVEVVDLADDLIEAKEMMRRPALQKAQLIIGPLHKGSLAVVSELSQKNQTYLVSPNSFSNEVFGENPYLFRAGASRETMLKYLANYVAINHQNHNVLMVSSESPKDWPERKLFKTYYNDAIGNFSNAFRDSIATITRKSLNSDNFVNLLRRDTLNVMVIPSNEPAFISDFITRLLVLERDGYPIQVYGLDQWVRFDNIESEYKNRFKLRLVVPNHVDYSSENVISFLEKYRDTYSTEPGAREYGFYGYDLTMYFGKALLNNGLSFGSMAEDITMEGVMGNYRFGRRSTGKDFENKSVLIIEYDDYTIKRVN